MAGQILTLFRHKAAAWAHDGGFVTMDDHDRLAAWGAPGGSLEGLRLDRDTVNRLIQGGLLEKKGNQMRATYGHSFDLKLDEYILPRDSEFFYHIQSKRVATVNKIINEGIRPTGRYIKLFGYPKPNGYSIRIVLAKGSTIFPFAPMEWMTTQELGKSNLFSTFFVSQIHDSLRQASGDHHTTPGEAHPNR